MRGKMKRLHEERLRTYREWKKHYNWHLEWSAQRDTVSPENIDIKCPCDNQKGRFRKKKCFDCGKTRCFGCHSDKYPKRARTYREKCSFMKLKEGIEQLEKSDVKSEDQGGE